MDREVFVLFEKYIPIQLWPSISKTAIVLKDISLLKWIGVNKKWYRDYYLKVTYKSQTIKKVRLSLQDKNVLKQNVKRLNQHLKSSQRIIDHLKSDANF